MSYFEIVKEAVEGRLIGWQEDLTVYDRSMLEDYDGEFLHGSRPTGTNTMLLDLMALEWVDSAYPPTLQAERSGAFLFGPNDKFLHGKDGVVREITKEEAVAIVDDFISRVAEVETLFKKVNLPAAAREIRGDGHRFWLPGRRGSWRLARRRRQ